ncbi:MAG: hypothetical protein KA007_00550 [Candidatus Pacebacteria bacterium]|nr:hypothetical protein [Candidatus Paceibacterota bacterium]
MKKEESTKVQLSFTLQKGVNDKFLSYCKDNLINKSQLLEKIIVSFMDSNDFNGMEKRL